MSQEKTDSDQPRLKGFSTVSLLTLVSRFTGLGRDALMASLFGTGWILDAFALAFRVPNMFRRLFGEGALTAAFLPEFVRVREDDPEGGGVLFRAVARRLLRTLLFIAVFAELAVVIAWTLLPTGARSVLLCELMMILIPYMVLVCMSGLFSAALHGERHFMMPALSPIVLNLIWLSGGVVIAKYVVGATDEIRLIGVAILIGGFAQVAMLSWQARKFGLTFLGPVAAKKEQAGIVFAAMAPVLVGLSITQVNAITDSMLAWVLSSEYLWRLEWTESIQVPKGTTSALYLGQRMFQFPLGVFAVALGTVLFPRFAKHSKLEDRSELRKDVVHGLQLVLVVCIPASVGLYLMAESITELAFKYRQFGDDSVQLTAGMIRSFAGGVWVYSALLILNRVFFAMGDQKTPVRQGLLCVGLNLIFDVALLPIWGAQALPLASVLATLVQAAFAMETLERRGLFSGVRSLGHVAWRVIVCSVVMAAIVYFARAGVKHEYWALPRGSYRLVKVVVPILCGAAVYWMGLQLMGIRPLKMLKNPWDPDKASLRIF